MMFKSHDMLMIEVLSKF